MSKNQTSFKPGHTGNPNGRPPKEWTWAGLIREALEQESLDGEPIKKAVSQALVDKALQGDVQAIKEIGDRIDGKARQQIDLDQTVSLKDVVADADKFVQ